jgi:hypothetical protein
MITLGQYVLQHYAQLMNAHEQAVDRHLTMLYKFRDHGPPAPGTAADTAEFVGLRRRWLSDDPAVVLDAQVGCCTREDCAAHSA